MDTKRGSVPCTWYVIGVTILVLKVSASTDCNFSDHVLTYKGFKLGDQFGKESVAKSLGAFGTRPTHRLSSKTTFELHPRR